MSEGKIFKPEKECVLMEEDVRAAARKIKEYCSKQQHDCDGCMFFQGDIDQRILFCKITSIPENWEV